MKKLLILAALAFGVVGLTAEAKAVGYANPFNAPSHQGNVFDKLFKRKPLPAFQAAPWYTYYPYNGHFMTPAPLPGDTGGYPGQGGNYGGNPYFPSNPAPKK